MKAVVFTGTREVAMAEVADATLEEPTDVLLRVTSSAICGTDLHMYDGRTGATPGLVLGHEPLGVVAEAGPAVADGQARRPGGDPHPPVLRRLRQLRPRAVRRLPAGPSRRVRCRLRVRGHGPVPGCAGRVAPGALRRRELRPGSR